MAYGKIKADTLVYDNSGSDVEKTVASLAAAAPTADPTFTGTVTIPTASANDNTTKAASTAYVQTELVDYAPLAAPALTGTATAVNLTLSGNLTVNGTTTTVNTATLEVEDKNIELGKVSSPSDTTADGGGITLKGATDKTITWVNSTDKWTFNEGIDVSNNISLFNYNSNDATTFALKVGNSGTGTTMAGIGFTSSGSQKASIRAHVLGDGKMTFHNNNDTEKMVLTAGGALSVTSTVSDSKGDLRSVPINSESSSYTLVAADAGKAVALNFTNGSCTINTSIFAAGDVVTIINASTTDKTITKGSGLNLYNTADGTDANRTLSAKGMATLIFVSHDGAYISGAGLS